MKINTKLLLPIILLCTMIISFVPASAATTTGLDFENVFNYETASQTFLLPSTYEATICLPKNFTERGGVIVGNYTGEQKPIFNLEVHQNGVPRLYINAKDSSGNIINYDVKFSKVNVATGEPVHLVITMDHATKTWLCYVNGALKQTISQAAPKQFEMTEKLRLGGDFRSGNGQYFKGSIQKLALYSDVRTAQEIADDASKTAIATDSLICGYDLSANTLGNYPEKFSSASGAAFDLTCVSDWIKTLPEPKDYAYSIAVVGDIQSLTELYPSKLPTMYKWIRDNVESKKIKFVIGLGDITENNIEDEYETVKQASDIIDGVVPFSIIRGNHDRAGLSSAMYDLHITQAKYGDEITGAYDSTMLNTYRILQIGQVKYMFMNLDYLLTDEVLTWANKIISKNSDCQVIVSTHIYMGGSGSFYKLDTSSGIGTKYGCENNGQGLWDKLLSKHENIVMLLCGHHPTDNIYYRQKDGANGHKVTEMLIDPQTTDTNYGGTGLVAMFYFSEDGKQLQVQYYSTIKDAYFKSNNQFTLTLDPRTSPTQPTTAPTTQPTAQPTTQPSGPSDATTQPSVQPSETTPAPTESGATQPSVQPTQPTDDNAKDGGFPVWIPVVIISLGIGAAVGFILWKKTKH